MLRYESYKPSGVEWLGEIPSHWNLIRLKRTITGCVNGVWGNDPKGENDIVCLRVADFNRQSLNVGLEKLTYRDISVKDRGSRLLKPNDLLLEKSGGGDNQLVGQVVIFDHDFEAVTSNFVAKMTVSEGYNPYFLNYLHACLYFNKINLRSIKQTTGIQNLDSASYLDEHVPSPPRNEQDKIVTFLSQKTDEIDTAIAKKQRLIELLQEQKSILINQAVTRGLNTDVPMCDSGVEWIGQIPAHWDVLRAKYLFREIDERSETGTEELLSVSHMTGVTPRSEKNVNMFMAEDYSGSKLCQPNDLIFNIMWAWMGALGVSELAGIVSPAYGVYRQLKSGTFNNWYLEQLLRSSSYVAEYNRRSRGLHSSRLRLYADMFFDMEIAIPPKFEQDEIEARTKAHVSKADEVISATEREIEKLAELRSTLIASAVTGQIKV
jgi:type I restriction enzyme S subunit